MRFEFGKNWTSFSQKALNEEGKNQARRDLTALLNGESLREKKFLDIGFGQGLTLCIATEQGALAHGLDIDDHNLNALKLTSDSFGFEVPPPVTIGSVLDPQTIDSLERNGKYDIVHSWGVLHHTGDMKAAIINASRLVKENGTFILSIYNRHWSSPFWVYIKRFYCWAPAIIQRAMVAAFYWIIYIAKFLVTGKNPMSSRRGMDYYHNVIDWIGGYPYEYASAHEIQSLLKSKGFEQTYYRQATVPTGCNEFVFTNRSASS